MNKLEEIYNGLTGEAQKAMGDLVHSLAESIKQNKKLEQKIDYIEQDNRLLRKKLYGSSSEKIDPNTIPTQEDLQLFNEFELVAQQVEPEALPERSEEKKSETSRGKAGRKSLPAHLPRVVVEHDLLPEEKICNCGETLEYIGTQTSEELEYTPPKLKVIEHRCKKYICAPCVENKDLDPSIQVTSKAAKKPAQLIGKSYATPSLLANIAVAKFCDHLPLYRQEQIFARLSIDLSRQTMSTWMLKVGESIIPLTNLMQDEILNGQVSFSDETTVQVLKEPGRRPQAKSYFWCFLGGAPGKQVVIYQYHPTRSAQVVNIFFAGYEGGLHCDGYGGYNDLLKSPKIIGINCWAHVRRKFFELLPDGKEKGVAGHVVRLIRLLYQVEENLKSTKADFETIKNERQKHAKPILETLKSYLDEKTKTSFPSGKLGEAIKYTLSRWPHLMTYIEDGRYEIDNNRSERAIKPFVMGRKNWLFSDSVAGANSSATLFSLIETAKLHGLNPTKYLEHVFKELPNCKIVEDFERLLPYNITDLSLKFSS